MFLSCWKGFCVWSQSRKSGEDPRKTITETTHYSHPRHPLQLKNYRKPYNCDGCKEQGFGSRYRCEECNYDLHPECAFAPATTSHKFFKSCTLRFLDRPPGRCCSSNCTRYCDACGKPIHGFTYHCRSKGWDLHPCCRNLTHKLENDGIEFRLKRKASSKCIWCNHRNPPRTRKGSRGWSYVSKCKKYRFHVYCVPEMLDKIWKDGDTSNESLSIENLNLHLPVSKNGSGARIVTAFLKTIAQILLGDPTITLTSLFLGLSGVNN